jgi:hypothetical protein
VHGPRIHVHVHQLHRRRDFTARAETKIQQVVFQPIQKAVVREQRPQQRNRHQEQQSPVKLRA